MVSNEDFVQAGPTLVPPFLLRRRRLLGALATLAAGFPAVSLLAQVAPPNVLLRFHAPNLGATDAKVNLVEFLDPACEGCRAIYPVVKQILADYPGRVRLWVRYVPFHSGADIAVRALEATRAQGKYWEALDALFTKQNQWTRNHSADPGGILKALEGIGLDLPRLRQDMASPDITRILETDMADAKALKVMQTPTFYVNGKWLQDFGIDQLRRLVSDEVRLQYGAAK
jgi:protein-disulfide isomerase